MNEHLLKISEDVRPRLLRAIRSLLMAGRDTVNVAKTLSPQASFGKYEGCYEAAILSIANDVCREVNAEIRKENAEIARLASASVREHFPDIARYFFRR